MASEKVRFLIADGETLLDPLVAGAAIKQLLHQNMSVYRPGYQFSSAYKAGLWDGKVKFFKPSQHSFPTGMLTWAVQIVKSRYPEMHFELVDVRKQPEGTPWKTNLVMRDYQEETIRQAMRCTRGMICAATGAGKTEIAIELMARIGVTSIFIVDNVDLLHQTADRVEASTPGICVRRIYAGGYQDSIRGKQPQIVITTFQTLSRKPHLIQGLKFDLKISDEAHGVAAATWSKVMNSVPAYYSFGLSGSFAQRFEDPIRYWEIVGATGKPIVNIPASCLVERNVLAKPTVTVLEFDKPISEPLTYSQEYDAAITYNPYLNKSLVKAVLKKHSGEKVLILLEKIEHGKSVARYHDIPFVSGKDDAGYRDSILKDFKTGRITSLIASRIFAQGIDIPDVSVIVNLGGGMSYKKVFQKLGRGMRKAKGKDRMTYYDFLPRTSGHVENHAVSRLDKYRYLGFEPVVRKVKPAT